MKKVISLIAITAMISIGCNNDKENKIAEVNYYRNHHQWWTRSRKG